MKLLSILFLFFSIGFANIVDFKSFQADFIQKVTNSLGTSIKYEGKIKIKGKNKILWQYKTPTIKNVFITKNSLIIDEPELEQVIITSLDKQFNIIKLINESKKISKNIYKNSIDGTTYQIVLKKNIPNSITYKDKLDNSVYIKFINGKKNIKLSDDIFYFNPPDYYDIIKK